jgi:siderophore synthetase component
VPADLELLSIFTDVFDCFLRFLSAVMDEGGDRGAREFWSEVSACVPRYPAANLQMCNNEEMVDVDDPVDALEIHGMIVNPMARGNRGPTRPGRHRVSDPWDGRGRL